MKTPVASSFVVKAFAVIAAFAVFSLSTEVQAKDHHRSGSHRDSSRGERSHHSPVYSERSHGAGKGAGHGHGHGHVESRSCGSHRHHHAHVWSGHGHRQFKCPGHS